MSLMVTAEKTDKNRVQRMQSQKLAVPEVDGRIPEKRD